MKVQNTQVCPLCRQTYLTNVLRIVRNTYRQNRPYAVICAGCQQNVMHAKTPSEETEQ